MIRGESGKEYPVKKFQSLEALVRYFEYPGLLKCESEAKAKAIEALILETIRRVTDDNIIYNP